MCSHQHQSGRASPKQEGRPHITSGAAAGRFDLPGAVAPGKITNLLQRGSVSVVGLIYAKSCLP
jgi:hypothetical protein